MKLTWILLMLAFASLTSCVVDDYDRDEDDDGDHVAVRTTGPVTTTHRRYITYSDTDPYYRVYYRDGDRAYYRQYYYDDDPSYRSRVDTQRYYYRTPASRASVQFGY